MVNDNLMEILIMVDALETGQCAIYYRGDAVRFAMLVKTGKPFVSGNQLLLSWWNNMLEVGLELIKSVDTDGTPHKFKALWYSCWPLDGCAFNRRLFWTSNRMIERLCCCQSRPWWGDLCSEISWIFEDTDWWLLINVEVSIRWTWVKWWISMGGWRQDLLWLMMIDTAGTPVMRRMPCRSRCCWSLCKPYSPLFYQDQRWTTSKNQPLRSWWCWIHTTWRSINW